MRTLAIDIGGTKFTVAVFDGRSDGSSRVALNRPGRRSRLDAEPDRIHRRGSSDSTAVESASAAQSISRISALHSRRTSAAGTISTCPAISLLNLAFATIMDNDANVGALGEGHYGAGKGYDPLFYMTLSTGIGGGIVHKGGVYRGADSYAGEIGHLTIRPDGPDCLCGAYGCFERICCGLWLERDHGKEARELIQDPAFVERYVVDLALGLKSAIMLLNPARIVIGGGIAKAGDTLFEPLRAGTAPADHSVVPRAYRCRSGSAWR